MMIACAHAQHQKYGKTRKGEQRYRCNLCGHVWFDAQPKLLGDMRVPVDTAKLALNLLTQGMSIRATERTTGIHRDTLCKLVVFFGDACKRFLEGASRGAGPAMRALLGGRRRNCPPRAVGSPGWEGARDSHPFVPSGCSAVAHYVFQFGEAPNHYRSTAFSLLG
jgi:transposase-like protein